MVDSAHDEATTLTAVTRIHPSLGLPGDCVLYTPQPLFSHSHNAVVTRSSSSPSSPWNVRVPGADIPNIFAHRQWRAGMLLADLIVRNGIRIDDKVVLELGAGTGLPSIAAARTERARFVLCTDYDSPTLIKTLHDNVRRNVDQRCMSRVRVAGHTWGIAIDDVEDLLPPSIKPAKADVILLADCIWDALSHAALVKSIVQLLRKDAEARVYMVSGLHTGRGKIEAFLRRACRAGLELVTLPPAIDADGHTPWPTLDPEDEVSRQSQLAAWASDEHLSRSADLIYEMEIAEETDCVTEEHVAQQDNHQKQRIWHSHQPRLTGKRRTFVVHERDEERQEVDGVHTRNRWITFLALRWAPVSAVPSK